MGNKLQIKEDERLIDSLVTPALARTSVGELDDVVPHPAAALTQAEDPWTRRDPRSWSALHYAQQSLGLSGWTPPHDRQLSNRLTILDEMEGSSVTGSPSPTVRRVKPRAISAQLGVLIFGLQPTLRAMSPRLHH
ncbi:hypothetical protein SKAU_G00282120 [Synaphobranchus kaupii]|uniref:Uncharacterized protein n=1 Tax=Synaphobranchus kaupii TaxID=118154 RepID=A0A9Q1INS3_SYNKA|nr:hypothetical protein SKAU_G00282120 [Synaphobranchus kaupii]